MNQDLKLERTFDAEPDVVFDAFLDPDSQRALYADSPQWIVESEIDLRVGGTWTIEFGPSSDDLFREVAVFTDVDRPRRIAYDLTGTFADGRSIDTQVEITLEALEGRTRMTLVQRGYPTAEMRDDFQSGWSDILRALGDVVIERIGRP
jgi:uncharacterized protein YndB with AHSA1/START domain